MSDADSPLELCLRYRDAFFARDAEAVLALVTPDFVFENVTAGERVEGIDAVRSHIAAIYSRWPDMRFLERDEGVMSGEHHAVAEWTACATHPDTGELIEWDGIDLIQVRDGRICRNAVYSSAHRARPRVSARTGVDT
ncbi:MAG TPA: nuclear transport factor 2 family protein [Gaiellales bacterium]|nr:nuclear transport factor 2 family protein [Gaiellales bacterium]